MIPDIDRIGAYLDELTEYLCDRLKSKNYEMISSRIAGERSAIVCIKHRADNHRMRSQNSSNRKR